MLSKTYHKLLNLCSDLQKSHFKMPLKWDPKARKIIFDSKNKFYLWYFNVFIMVGWCSFTLPLLSIFLMFLKGELRNNLFVAAIHINCIILSVSVVLIGLVICICGKDFATAVNEFFKIDAGFKGQKHIFKIVRLGLIF
jgi:hypothetical protein